MEQVKQSAFAAAGKRARILDVSPVSRENPFRRARMQWLKRLVVDGVLEKSKKGARYSIPETRLFEPDNPRKPTAKTRPAGMGK